MSHPTTMLVGGTYRTEFQVYDLDNPGESKAPDATPTATVTKNGSATGDSVTIAAAAGAATGHYKLSYTPSGAAAGDTYAIRIVSVIATVSYPETITFVAVPATVDANVVSMATDSISAAAVSAAAVTKIQSGLATSAEIAALESGLIVSASSSVLDTIDDGGNITLRRGDRVSFSLTLGNVSGRTGEKLFFTIKRQNTNDTDDSNAIVQITETTGAVLVNGSSTGVTAADASITVSNETTGVTVFVIQDSITTLFPVGSGWHYDVQMIRADGKAVTLTYGSVTIVADTTRRKTI